MSDELIDAVNSAYAGGEFQHAKDAAKLIPDELVKKIAFCGTPGPGEGEARLAARAPGSTASACSRSARTAAGRSREFARVALGART